MTPLLAGQVRGGDPAPGRLSSRTRNPSRRRRPAGRAYNGAMTTKTTTIRTRTKAPFAIVAFTATGEGYLVGYAYTHAAAAPRARKAGGVVLPVEGGKVVATKAVAPVEAPCPARTAPGCGGRPHVRATPGVGVCVYCGEVA